MIFPPTSGHFYGHCWNYGAVHTSDNFIRFGFDTRLPPDCAGDNLDRFSKKSWVSGASHRAPHGPIDECAISVEEMFAPWTPPVAFIGHNHRRIGRGRRETLPVRSRPGVSWKDQDGHRTPR